MKSRETLALIPIHICMNDGIFIDTGPLLARYLANDNLHKEALSKWSKLEKKKNMLVTSLLVINETATLLARRASPQYAAARIQNIYLSQRFTILRTDTDIELKALKLLEKYADLPLSFTDAVSVCLMRSHTIRQIYTFDADFQVTGFSLFN